MTYLVRGGRLVLRGQLDLARGTLGERKGAILRTVGDCAVQVRDVDGGRHVETVLVGDVLVVT